MFEPVGPGEALERRQRSGQTLILALLMAVVGGSLWYKRHIDEIEQAAQIWGIATAGTVVIVLYPVWYLLWRGEMIGEPSAHVVFGALYVIMAGGYLWKKFR